MPQPSPPPPRRALSPWMNEMKACGHLPTHLGRGVLHTRRPPPRHVSLVAPSKRYPGKQNDLATKRSFQLELVYDMEDTPILRPPAVCLLLHHSLNGSLWQTPARTGSGPDTVGIEHAHLFLLLWLVADGLSATKCHLLRIHRGFSSYLSNRKNVCPQMPCFL